MADDLRGKWKETGKGLGFAFRDLGKTIIKSGATAVKKADDWANKEDCSEKAEETATPQDVSTEETTVPASGKQAPNFCADCGSALNSDAKFCPNCGAAL
ncbi:MAG: zinc-ribbon domain-containing protein [Clostridia bacterium]|nr:zinc-ribbon domain-containing protein [Clostridia bacterium]